MFGRKRKQTVFDLPQEPKKMKDWEHICKLQQQEINDLQIKLKFMEQELKQLQAGIPYEEITNDEVELLEHLGKLERELEVLRKEKYDMWVVKEAIKVFQKGE